MSKFEFVSHQKCPEDEFIDEIVYLCFDEKYRIAYVRKKAKNGGLFWSAPSISVKTNGEKEYLPTFLQDSNFLERDIKKFLDDRVWEKQKTKSEAVIIAEDDLPF